MPSLLLLSDELPHSGDAVAALGVTVLGQLNG